MNGVMRASVSPGSSHRDTRVTCTPMAMVPSGGTAGAGLAAPRTSSDTTARIAIERTTSILYLPEFFVRPRLPRPLTREGELHYRGTINAQEETVAKILTPLQSAPIM